MKSSLKGNSYEIKDSKRLQPQNTQAQYKLDGDEEVEMYLESNAEQYKDIGAQLDEDLKEEREANVELDDELEADKQPIFAAAVNDGEDESNNDLNDGGEINIKNHIELNCKEEINGSTDSNVNVGNNRVRVGFSVKFANMNINISLQSHEDIQNVTAATARVVGIISPSHEAGVIVSSADNAGSSVNGLGAGQETERGEGEEGSEAEGDHFC